MSVHRSLTSANILQAARDLIPLIESRAEEIAQQRRLPVELVARLKEAGIFRTPMPKAWGGPEMSPREMCEVVEIIATADASAGWCAMIGSDSGLYSAFLEESVARRLYPNLDAVTAGQIALNGRAERVPGGYRVTGRWRFGSGCTHADVISGHCVVFEHGQPSMARTGPPGLPESIMVLAPASEWQIHDTWYSTGLAGSGSHDYSANELFVPEERTFTFLNPIRRTEALYAYKGSVLYNHPGVELGLARHAIDLVITIADTSRVTMPPPPRLAKTVPAVRTAVARAEMLLGAARAYCYETRDAVWEELQRDHDLSTGLRRSLILSGICVSRTTRAITQLMFDTVGTTALYTKCPLDRLLRDAITISQHMMVQDGMLESIGAMMLGESSSFPLL
jgi:alkylation response protein AidB-like acyl-CoA dehydrogenase